MKPPSTARTAGRSDRAECRLRRQPFILLFVTASSIPLVSAENGENSLIPLRLLFPPNPLRWASAGDLFSSTNRPTCLRYAEGASHMAWESPLQRGSKSYSHNRRNVRFIGLWRDTHHPIPEPRTQRLTRRNRGRFGWGCYLYPRTVLCGSETLHGRVSERQTLPLLGLGRGESRRAQRAFGTAMRMMRVAVPRRRGPVGTCSPAAGSCAVLVSFTVCHRCVEIQERAFTRLAVPTALSALCDVQWFCPMQ